jgi:hypothetical protein
MSRGLHSKEHATCTAVAPDFVLTVLGYGTSQLSGHR